MHEIDLSKYNIRSDLIIENIKESNLSKSYLVNNIKVNYLSLKKDKLIKGDYITISIEDITDKTNFSNVLKVLIKELKRILKLTKIKKDDKVLIIGLGNNKSTSDSLGYETLKDITVTRHLFMLNEVVGYRNISILEPNVFGNTGIESKDIILGVVKETKPDFLIVIDSLAANDVSRMLKTIQITNTGIHPGSGIGNNRGEISQETINIPVIAIGVPTVVSSISIVNDTIKLLTKKINYYKNNYQKDEIFSNNINYLKENNDLSQEEKQKLLGLIGTLDENTFKDLIYETLNPIGYDLIVTTKEIDFIIEKFGKLISSALNTCLKK